MNPQDGGRPKTPANRINKSGHVGTKYMKKGPNHSISRIQGEGERPKGREKERKGISKKPERRVESGGRIAANVKEERKGLSDRKRG